ncbi:MAG: putative 4-hydroxybenzoate polyprenyltransferase [Zetaproteobacteria bacterium]|nr:putative 4-hydroxybenzoate polyprenyltransferase [Zetaproteobacteria bacterium]
MAIMRTTLLNSKYFLEDIKIEHSLFALPFAFSMLWWEPHISVRNSQIVALFLAMVTARSFAMGCNRLIDRHLDALNPRTALRKVASGELSVLSAQLFIASAAVSFILVAYWLRPLCGALAPIVLGLLALYSYLKRFTILCHLYLGICLSLSPLSTLYAIGGIPSWDVYVVCMGIAFWVAGFDVIYAMQDTNFDYKAGLYSIPARIGNEKALLVSGCLYLGAIAAWLNAGWQHGLGKVYFLALTCIAIVLLGQIALTEDQLRRRSNARINFIFFHLNSWVGVFFLSGLVLDEWTRR